MSKVQIVCRIRRGLFRDEFVVAIETLQKMGKETREFVANRKGVILDQEPQENQDLPAKVTVYLVEKRESSATVLIPASAASDPAYFNVPLEVLASAEPA